MVVADVRPNTSISGHLFFLSRSSSSSLWLFVLNIARSIVINIVQLNAILLAQVKFIAFPLIIT
jgi:hypothetical protein